MIIDELNSMRDFPYATRVPLQCVYGGILYGFLVGGIVAYLLGSGSGKEEEEEHHCTCPREEVVHVPVKYMHCLGNHAI